MTKTKGVQKGVFIYQNGDKYVGEWNNSKGLSNNESDFQLLKHGQGTLISANGDVKQGIWEKNKFIGSDIKSTGNQRSGEWQGYVCRMNNYFDCKLEDKSKRIMLPTKYSDKETCYEETEKILDTPKMKRLYPDKGGPEKEYFLGCVKE